MVHSIYYGSIYGKLWKRQNLQSQEADQVIPWGEREGNLPGRGTQRSLLGRCKWSLPCLGQWSLSVYAGQNPPCCIVKMDTAVYGD